MRISDWSSDVCSSDLVPPSGYSTTTMAQDLFDVMDEHGIAKAAVIGHSYGGAIALEAVATQPSRFTHLCLMDTRVQRVQPQLRLRDIDALTVFERAVAAHDGGDRSEEHTSELQSLM